MAKGQWVKRIGSGSVGGKGRALGYLSQMLAERGETASERHRIVVPQATAITTNEFQRFVERNDLGHCITSRHDDVTQHAFLRGRFEHTLFTKLRGFLSSCATPLAVRSSSLNEDAYDHPFAGLYKTVLLPNNAPELETRLNQLCQAIKLVYASTLLNAPKAYMRAHGLPIEEEAMAVILQPIAGQARRMRFYPRLAGVARSINYFPVGGVAASDGHCRLVVGLGTSALGGDEALSFAPTKPTVLPGRWSPREIQRGAQKHLDVLDLTRGEIEIADERTTIKTLPLGRVRNDGVLADLESWWNRDDDTLYDGGLAKGEPLLTFRRLLKGEIFPLAEQLSEMLSRAEEGFRGPVELEFAADFDRTDDGIKSCLSLVQVRRVGRPTSGEAIDLDDVTADRVLLSSRSALGNGVWRDIRHVVYVPPGRRSPDEFSRIAAAVGEINQQLLLREVDYMLIGPGRWGSKNRALGAPVSYNQVSRAAAIVEVSSGDFVVEPSQGTHFFHNIAAGRVFYLAVNETEDDRFNRDWLDARSGARGTGNAAVRLIELEQPLHLLVDGRTQRAHCLLPDA